MIQSMFIWAITICWACCCCSSSLYMCHATILPANSNMAEILKYTNENMDSEGYAFSFETSDGISRQESAMLRHAGTPMEALEVQGSVNWIGPDGIHYKLNYLADENGFQPQGEHLPQLETTQVDH